LPIQVQSHNIDYNNHVNNVVYLQWVQKVAEAHWVNNASSRWHEKYIWVVINHFIEYKNPAFEKEELIAETYVNNYGKASCERHTKIFRISDKKLIVQAKTTWCLLDKQTQKPTRIPDELKALFS